MRAYHENGFIKVLLKRKKRLVDKVCYQGENNYIMLLTMRFFTPLYTTLTTSLQILLSYSETQSLKKISCHSCHTKYTSNPLICSMFMRSVKCDSKKKLKLS